MKLNPFKIFLMSCLLSVSATHAQETLLQAREKQLVALGDSILKGSTNEVRTQAAEVFLQQFENFLSVPASFDYAFTELKNVSALKSSDDMVRIYTWLLPAVDLSRHDYFGFIQVKSKKTGSIVNHKLQNAGIVDPDVELRNYDCTGWIGTLYYKLITVKSGRETYYTLLGWKGNNRQSTLKIIESLQIKNSIPEFGLPVFLTEKGKRKRIVFEFNARAVMSLQYHEKEKLIAFDHLAPPSPELTGNFAAYGPDMTYDGFRLEKGTWNFVRNLELRNNPQFDKSQPASRPAGKELYSPEK